MLFDVFWVTWHYWTYKNMWPWPWQPCAGLANPSLSGQVFCGCVFVCFVSLFLPKTQNMGKYANKYKITKWLATFCHEMRWNPIRCCSKQAGFHWPRGWRTRRCWSSAPLCIGSWGAAPSLRTPCCLWWIEAVEWDRGLRHRPCWWSFPLPANSQNFLILGKAPRWHQALETRAHHWRDDLQAVHGADLCLD